MPVRRRPRSRKKNDKTLPEVPHQVLEALNDEALNGNLEDEIQFIKQLIDESDDLETRRFRVFGHYDAAMLYFSSLIDKHIVNTDILKPLMSLPDSRDQSELTPFQLRKAILDDALSFCETKTKSLYSDIVTDLLNGRTVIFVAGLAVAFTVNTFKKHNRSINQPETEQVLRGAREGFIESLETNIALLRYRLPTADFCVKTMSIGRVTKTKVAVCYLKGIVNPELVKEVKDRLEAIDIDGVNDSGFLEQFIEENTLSPFPQVQNTERPDKSVANLLEGRVVIVTDGTPFALIVPAVFGQFYQTIDDYSERFLMGSLVRMIRLVALIFSLVFPSLYVAIISYNPELIPTEFAVAVAGGRAGVPFPTVVEVFIMEVSMEVLREATLRLPQQVGGALSIVGALVIGQSAVAAGFASPITVVIIALTTIGSFATPAYNAAIALRMLRFPLLFLAGTFGLYGLMVGLIIIINHVLSLKSFGVPYASPLVPGNWQGMKDMLFRAPLWKLKKRPLFLHPLNKTRVGDSSEEAIKQAPSNTLDPLKVGNERWEDGEDGISQTDNRHSGGSDSD